MNIFLASISILLALASLVALSLAYGYAAYWALMIRSALVVPLYRNRALGNFVVMIAMALLSFYEIFPSYLFDPSFGNGIEGVIILTLVSVGLFYWVDTSALTARRSDPLFRNTLHWQQVRIVLWFVILADSAYLIALDFVSPFYTYGTPLTLVPFWTVVVSGAIILIRQARRTKDVALRGSLKWSGLFFLALFASYFPSVFVTDVFALLLATALNLLGAYFLYRSVRALIEVSEKEKFRIANSQRDHSAELLGISSRS